MESRYEEEEIADGPSYSLGKGTTSIHVTALDGLVNVNSLFTLAVFVGLTATSPSDGALVENSNCYAGEDIRRNLLTFQVVSFGSFLFSSLVAQGLKQAIVLINSNDVKMVFKAHINNTFLRVGMLFCFGFSLWVHFSDAGFDGFDSNKAWNPFLWKWSVNRSSCASFHVSTNSLANLHWHCYVCFLALDRLFFSERKKLRLGGHSYH